MKSNSYFPTVGIIGAGQMARMMIEAAHRLNINVRILAKSSDDCAALIANDLVIADFESYSDLNNFTQDLDVITFDNFEYSIEALNKLSQQNIIIRPDVKTITKIQNVDILKDLLHSAGINFINEKVNTTREISVQIARSPHGQTVVYPIVQITKIDNILDEVISPAPNLSDIIASQLQHDCLKISEIFNIVGVFSVNFSDMGNNKFVINQIKLGPTNEGHWTIDGSTTSQFENHLRAVLDLPLGSPKLISSATVMVNVLGGQYIDMYKPFLHCMAHDPALRIHLYGKEIKQGRKVGHVNICGDNVEDLLIRAHHAADYLTGKITE